MELRGTSKTRPSRLDGSAADSDLIAACIAGDGEAWRTLVRRHERLVYSVPRRLGLPADLVDDTFQEVFVILLRRLPSLVHHQALPQWLITTSRRVALRLAERSRRTVTLRTEFEHESETVAIEQHELAARVADALESLNEDCRSLLTALVRRDHATYAQIAEELRMPIGSIGPKRARCLARLLRALQQADKSP